MTSQRQQAFQKLRPPCVELSATALKFKANQASVKQVLAALKNVRDVLIPLGEKDLLDEKLAEYAFFPLTHIFNETQRLSSSCLEIAVQCTTVLVSKGWRRNIAPNMGKQLLILMSLLAGGHPQRQGEVPSDDLKVAAFDCIGHVIEVLASSEHSENVLDDKTLKGTIDQLVYIILESITDNPSEQVQLGAANALLRLIDTITDHVMLASLLPRTISSLTKALRPSVQVRRTRKVLELNLNLFSTMLHAVLADKLLSSHSNKISDESTNSSAEEDILDAAWLRATAPQINTALTQVVKLRSHESQEVQSALATLCLVIIEDCSGALSDSLPIVIDTLAIVACHDKTGHTQSNLRHLVLSRPEITDLLRTRLYEWVQTLPRVMLSSDDRSKEILLSQISSAINMSTEGLPTDDGLITLLATNLVASFSPEVRTAARKPPLIESSSHTAFSSLTEENIINASSFASVFANSSTQKEALQSFDQLVKTLQQSGLRNRMVRTLVDRISDLAPDEQMTATWLSLTFLGRDNTREFDINSLLEFDMPGHELQLSRAYLVSDLYANMLPFLMADQSADNIVDWRLKAIALECTVLQAEQLDISYRSELLDTLYPIISLLDTRNESLRSHAVVALNRLAKACKYTSVSSMLIENVDYLINAVGMKLNSFDISPQAPRVLLMMVRLCGAKVVPYLDDLIGSIFGALDNFHGYPQLVELLFRVLQTIVDECKAQPDLVITNEGDQLEHLIPTCQSSQLQDVISDLRKRKNKKRKFEDDDKISRKAPTKPWKSTSTKIDGEEDRQSTGENEGENMAMSNGTDEKKVLSKTHQLLLNIAQATSPHLTSPSPQIRHVLMEILEQVSPLLARDENTFLPLINSVWPAIIPRLLAQVDGTNNDELSYNVCAAADAIRTLCTGAGSFMTSRIENLLPGLVKLFHEVKARVMSSTIPKRKQDQIDLDLGPVLSRSHSGDAKILQSLVKLLCAILSHVRLKDDGGDQIVSMLAPFSGPRGIQDVTEVLAAYNSDMLWLWQQLTEGKDTAEPKLLVLEVDPIR